MRFLTSLFLGLVAAALAIALAVFALQNLSAVQLQFLGYSGTGNVWWVALAAAALGFVVAILLTAPGRVAASWRIQGLSRQMQHQDQEYATLRQQQTDIDTERAKFQREYQQMQAQRDQLANDRHGLIVERDQLVAERNRLLNGGAQFSQPVQQPAAQPVEQPAMAEPQPAVAIIPGMAAAPFVEMPPTPSTTERTDAPREDIVYSQKPNSDGVREPREQTDAASDEQPSLADRVRDLFRGSSRPSAPDNDNEDTTLPDSAFPREDRPVSPMP